MPPQSVIWAHIFFALSLIAKQKNFKVCADEIFMATILFPRLQWVKKRNTKVILQIMIKMEIINFYYSKATSFSKINWKDASTTQNMI